MNDPDHTFDPQPTPDLISLSGVRKLCASEPCEGTVWQEGLIKQLTRGEPMLVREFKDWSDCPPDFDLRISGRHCQDSEDRGQ